MNSLGISEIDVLDGTPAESGILQNGLTDPVVVSMIGVNHDLYDELQPHDFNIVRP